MKGGWTVSQHRRVDAIFANLIFGLFFGGRATSALFVGVHLIPKTIKGRGQFSVRDRPYPSSICFRFSHRACLGHLCAFSCPSRRLEI